MKKLSEQPVIIKIQETSLTEAGRWLLAIYEHQQRMLAGPRPGVWYAEIHHAQSPDLLCVILDDQLSYAQRALIDGIEGLTLAPPVWSGHYSEMAPYHPLPTEEYARMLGKRYEGWARQCVWCIPDDLVAQAPQQEGSAIINQAARLLQQWMQERSFQLWRNPDWITQVEAEQLVKVSRATIAGAVATGVLDTWMDMDEPNPRRRVRVRRSQVLKRWGKVANHNESDEYEE